MSGKPELAGQTVVVIGGSSGIGLETSRLARGEGAQVILTARDPDRLHRELKKHEIHKLIVVGLIAHTCVEATVRYAAELGYEVTMVRDATADYSDNEMHAALDVNLPSYASAIVTTNQVVDALSSVQA